MRVYNPHKYNPARGGHTQGHLRDAFATAVEEYMTHPYSTDDPDPIVKVGDHEVEMPLSRLCGLLWNCTDCMPSGLAELIFDRDDHLHRRTYAVGARAVKVMTQLKQAIRSIDRLEAAAGDTVPNGS